MKHFVALFEVLDNTISTKKKIDALVSFFDAANDKDKIWAIALFSHKRPRRTVTTTLLRTWAAEASHIPLWLFEESYHVVGDLAETIALVLPPPTLKNDKNLNQWIEEIANLQQVDEDAKQKFIVSAWAALNFSERFLFNKIITGGFRVGVSQKSVIKALAKYTSKDENVIAHKLMGNWDPFTITFDDLILQDDEGAQLSKPYPFYLAYALDKEVKELGKVEEWQVEWKWDGIRGQLIKRDNSIYLWSRGEDLITNKFPEFELLRNISVDRWVIDGEILCYKNGLPLDFSLLQTRIGRKKITKSVLQKAPVVLMAYDLLEYDGRDLRSETMAYRRKTLESLVSTLNSPKVIISDLVDGSWEELQEKRSNAREHHTEGLMLKKRSSTYKVGRKKGEWWKWKLDPLTIDAVMIYAMRGHGRRSNLFTDFTFAVSDGEKLVSFTKAYSGLTDIEFAEVTRFVQRNTTDRHGPVRVVKPELVFEIAFEGIRRSKRHKSGVALRFPRIKRWRKDKTVAEINTIDDLTALLPS